MPSLKTTHPLALRLLMTDDIYQLNEPEAALIPAAEKEKPTGPAAELSPAYFNYLGENNKYLLLLVDNSAYEHINPDNMEALVKILTAKNLELKDIALLNISYYPDADFDVLKTYFACSKIALFGVDPKQIRLPDIKGNQVTVHKEVKVLATFSFEEMHDEDAKKRLFWNEMKNL